MHHALHIEEILLNIFSHCYTLVYRRSIRPTRKQRCYANVHLTTLARTCKTFKEPALDLIWAELMSLIPLVRCLPQESWVNESEFSVYSLRKPLEQTEWDIILRYAHRVRNLHLRDSFGLAVDCIKALSNPPVSGESIFPNLRVVALHDPNAAIAPLIRHLTNPKVTDISLVRPSILGTTIDAFGERCPFVADVYVSDWSHTNAISDLVCHWKYLRSVQCYKVSLNADALSHLACLRDLQCMALPLHDAVVGNPHVTSILTFSALYNLDLRSQFLVPVERLLRHLRLPVIRDLSIGLDAHPTAPDLMSFFAALQEACTHTSLNDLLLRVYHSDETITLTGQGSPPYYITFDRLRSLAVFVNIASITLDISCGMDLNEREFLTLASSWPHLEAFEVGENYDWGTSSGITPGGFVQLLERCRSLRVLYFMFDARGYRAIPQGHPWGGLAMPAHAFLHLLNSPIEAESIEALGVFFHVAPYPDFNLTTHWNNRYFGGTRGRPEALCDLYYDRWVKARGLARELWEERRELRQSIETRPLQRCSQ